MTVNNKNTDVHITDNVSFREELTKCQEHIEELQKDKDAVSKEIEEAQSQNNM